MGTVVAVVAVIEVVVVAAAAVVAVPAVLAGDVSRGEADILVVGAPEREHDPVHARKSCPSSDWDEPWELHNPWWTAVQ